MLTTSHSFEELQLEDWSSGVHERWRLVSLAKEMPWFTVSFRLGEGRAASEESVLLGWESALLALMNHVGCSSITSVQHLALNTLTHAWHLRQVCEVWEYPLWKESLAGPLLFRFCDADGLFDRNLHHVGEMESCRLLLRLPPAKTW